MSTHCWPDSNCPSKETICDQRASTLFVKCSCEAWSVALMVQPSGGIFIFEKVQRLLSSPLYLAKVKDKKKKTFFLNIQANTMWNFVKNKFRTKTSLSLILVFNYFYVIQGKYTKEKVKLWHAIYSAQYTFPSCHFCTFCEKVLVTKWTFLPVFTGLENDVHLQSRSLATLLQTHFPFLWFISILEAIFN